MISLRFAQVCFAASWLASSLLIGGASADARKPAPVSAQVPEARGSGPTAPESKPAATQPAQFQLPASGTVGFGWG